jgi:hypothetical protein
MKEGQDSMFDFYERFMPENAGSKAGVKDGDITTHAG